MITELALAAILERNNIVVPTIECKADIPVEECLDAQGFGNYELLGPFDREDGELVYVGYLDPLNQINIVAVE